MQPLGRALVTVGLVLLVAGGIIMLLGRGGVRSLPGDFAFSRGNWRFYFPLGTSILISVVLTLLFWLFGRFR